MDIHIETRGSDTEVFAPDGALNIDSAGQLKTLITERVHAGVKSFVIDLAGVEFIDSSGLSALVSGLRAARQVGGDLRVAQVTEAARAALRASNLDRVFVIHDSVDEALKRTPLELATERDESLADAGIQAKRVSDEVLSAADADSTPEATSSARRPRRAAGSVRKWVESRGNSARSNIEATPEHREVTPISPPTAEIDLPPVLPSGRLERIAEYFRAQAQLLDTMNYEFEREMAPLRELLAQQSVTMELLLTNLEQRLAPLYEYAENEQANLDAMEQRISDPGTNGSMPWFAGFLADQRERIATTRAEIDIQRRPLLVYGEEQRDALEVALSRFDSDMDVLKRNSSEQRRVLLGMLESMRSDTFIAVRDLLVLRQETLEGLAAADCQDPVEIGSRMQQLDRVIEPMADRPQVRSVLDHIEQADRSFVATRR